MSELLNNPIEWIKKTARFFDRGAQFAATDRSIAVLLSVPMEGRYLYYFDNPKMVDMKESFFEMLPQGRIAALTLLRRPIYGLLWKDYRKVDSSHLNKLHTLANKDITDINVQGIPALLGLSSLPGGFVVAQAINKTAAGATFDRALGSRYLMDDLAAKMDERLWELEGYRIYRLVNTLDSISRNLIDGDLAAKLLANGAGAFRLPNSEGVLVCAVEAPASAFKPDQQKLTVISLESYYRIVSIIDSYIERGD
jgi:hypothetical protein